jgi:hypothetical protein
MTLLRLRSTSVALVSVAVLALVGCGSDKPKTSSTTTASGASTTAAGAASTTTASPASTTTAGGASTTAASDDEPATTNAPPVPVSTNADGLASVSVVVGTDDFETTGGKRVVSVKKGTTISISLTDPSIAEEYHLHGYDLEFEAAKGAAGKVTFTADETGQFDLESHTTEKILLVLVVS